MVEEERRSDKHQQPLDALSEMANRQIIIKLVDKTEIVGRLIDFDQYMNLKVEVAGQEILIRGNNVVLIGTDWKEVRVLKSGSLR